MPTFMPDEADEDDLDPKVKAYLTRQIGAGMAEQSPEYRRSLRDDAADMAAQKRDNNLSSLLMNSAAKLGTVNGKQADSSEYDRFTQAQNAGVDRSMETQEKPTGLDMRLVDYLKSRGNSAQQAKLKQAQMTADQSERDRHYGIEQQKLALEREKLGIERDKSGKGGNKVASGTAQEIGGFDAAFKMAEDLEDAYNNGASQTGSSVKSFLPGSDANKYEKNRDLAAQTIGVILEKGKLTDKDYERYRNMLPKPSDPNDVANEKMRVMKNLILAKKRGEIGGLQQSGFETSGFGAVPDTVASKIKTDKSGQAMAAPGRVTVTNGKETLEIDVDDLEDARRDGFKRVE